MNIIFTQVMNKLQKENKKEYIMEFTNTILFTIYGGVLFMLTGLAIYYSERVLWRQDTI